MKTDLNSQIEFRKIVNQVVKNPTSEVIVESLKELKALKAKQIESIGSHKKEEFTTKNPLRIESGLTVSVLKEYISRWPEKNEHGEPYQIWVGDSYGLSHHAKLICRLNVGDLIIE